MTSIFKAACIQNSASDDLTASLDQALGLSKKAIAEGAQFIVLPEFFSCYSIDDFGLHLSPYPEDQHPALPLFSKLAADTNTFILLGSLAITAAPGKIYNRSYLINDQGHVQASYEKIHLFDVNLFNGEMYRESDACEAGSRAVITNMPWMPLGMSICYDVRFPNLYRTLAQNGVGIISVPAAFTKTTGIAHWHVLLRARAIENGCYIIAPCQAGHHGKAETFGHSLIINPWGEIIVDGGEDIGFIIAEIDPDKVKKARSKIPSLEHDREFELITN